MRSSIGSAPQLQFLKKKKNAVQQLYNEIRNCFFKQLKFYVDKRHSDSSIVHWPDMSLLSTCYHRWHSLVGIRPWRLHRIEYQSNWESREWRQPANIWRLNEGHANKQGRMVDDCNEAEFVSTCGVDKANVNLLFAETLRDAFPMEPSAQVRLYCCCPVLACSVRF